MKKLKLFFACLLMAVLSIGQVWAADPTVTSTFTNKDWAVGDGEPAWTASAITTTQLTSGKGVQVTLANIKNAGGFTLTNSTIKNIEGLDKIIGVSLDVSSNGTGGSISGVTVNGTTFQCNSSDTYTVTKNDNQTPSFTHATGDKGDIVISFASTVTSKSLYTLSITVTYTTSGGGSEDPAVSADPDEVTDVPAAGVTNQTIDLTYENITGYETEASVHPNADGTGTLSPAWLSASVSDADDYATVTYSVSANDGAARTAYIKVYTTDGDKEATTIIPVSQVKYSAPTGTFALFEGDLEEGDYIICSGTTALQNALATNTNYIGYETVTVNNDEIDNPSENLVWHIAQSGGYWTIHNVAANNYAASTGVKNKGQVITDGTDDKALWTASGTSSYEFVNKANTAASVNSNLRYNSGYGFACYSTSTGSALTLYKKQVTGQPKAPTFSIPGGNYETAQSVELSCETVGAKIYYTLDGSKPSSTSTEYSTAIPVSATTTIKAVAIKDEIESTVATATYTIVVWQTVADVWDDITADGPTNAHIYGYVSQTNVSGYANNFYISDNGSTEGNQLYAYRMDMNSFTVAVGDKVKLAGDLTLYNDVKEFKYTNADNCGKVIALEAKGALQSVAVSGTPTKTEYAANETFDPAGLKVYGTYANGFVGEITEGITWGNDLTDGKVTENTTVHVTAIVSEITSPAYDVPVTVAAKTLVSITLSYDAVEVYQGLELPKPTVTATYSEGDPEDVTAQAVFTGYDASTTGDQEITVTYTFGGHDETANYTVTVNPIFNVELAASVARNLIVNVVGNTESTDDMIVRGKVSYINNASSNAQTYWISDDGTRTNEVEIFKGKYLSGADFTSANQLRVGDEVVVIGKVINYNNSTPEFANGKSEVQSHVRTPNFAITDVTALEVGATDLAVADLTINVEGEGAVTLASSDNTDAVTIIDGKLHAVAVGDATITANLAANGIYKAATAEFNVTVIPATVKYAITFDGNGADGGSAPVIADKAAGVSVDLPANSFTYAGHLFAGWKVFNDDTSEEIEVNAGAFEMPASTVTIQAQWAEISVWATTYTSNVTLSYTGSGEANSQVKINDEDYAAQKVGSSGNDGFVVVTVPYGTHTLHFHAVAWNGKSVTIAASGVENMSESSFTLAADPGFKSSGTYTLENDPVGQYFVMTFTAVTEETQITFSKTAGDDKRFMLYGVNQEGGVLPVLDHITITGTMTNTTGWKTGDEITPEGLIVNAYYTLNEVMQDPVNVTSSVVWSHAALVKDQTEVTLTATYTDGVAKSANVNVTIEAVETGDPTIITDPALYLNFGASVEKDAVVAPKTITVTLKNIAGATATLGGTNYSAFSIDDTEIVDGDIITVSVNTGTPGVYAGTVTIKDNDSETEKVINLSMTVLEPEVPETAVSTTSQWVAATDADLVDGAEVLITGATGGVTYAIGVQNDNNRAAVAGTLEEGVFTPGENTMSFTLVAQETEGVFALQTSNGEYLYAASSSKNYLKRQATVDGNAKWTLTATSAVANGENTHNDLKFNATNSPKIFSCYTGGQTEIQFYVPKPVTPPTPVYETVRSGLEINRYYTVCLPKKVTAIKGASFWTLNNKSQDGATAYLEEETNNLPFAAGKPFIIQATADKLEVVYEGEPTETAGVNGAIHGTLTYMDADALAAAGSNVYMLYNNELRPVGENNHLDANRAYVKVDELDPVSSVPQGAPGKRVIAMPMQKDETQGIEDVQGDNVQSTKVLINGNLYILRGEKVYDATGRLVK